MKREMTYEQLSAKRVTGTELAAVLGISVERLRQLASRNILIRSPDDNKFALAESIQHYLEFRAGQSLG